MNWITFLQIVALIFEIGVVVMVVMNFWRNIKEEAFNKKLAAFGKMLEAAGKKMEEMAKNKASAKNSSESIEELLKSVKSTNQDQPRV